MKYANQYAQSALAIIKQYNCTMPFAAFLKSNFSQHKKYGSKDRRCISHLCYCYYRLGHTLKELPPDQRMRIGLFLCQETPREWDNLFEQQWLDNWSPILEQRINFVKSIYTSFAIEDIFPWLNMLSEGIDRMSFAISLLMQPDLFLRIRPGYENKVRKQLANAKLPVTQLNDTCIALPNASKIDAFVNIDKEVVIQDYSSQRIASFFEMIQPQPNEALKVWDCCAASGGKSILANDVLKNIDLTVSDIRSSILRNLQQRFEKAGIKEYNAFVADVTKNSMMASAQLIICDAPCSGSGTWGRTPEQLACFSTENINTYATLQKEIVDRTVTYLETNGHFLYITCSVFKAENEDVVGHLLQQHKLTPVKTALLKGYDKKADTLFAALFKKD